MFEMHFLSICRLHGVTSYPWRPQLSSFEFQRLLHNLTAIKIRGTYNKNSKYSQDVCSTVNNAHKVQEIETETDHIVRKPLPVNAVWVILHINYFSVNSHFP